MPIKYLPRVVVSAIIGVIIFMSIMPDKTKGMPEWIFYSAFAMSLLTGWLITTGVFRFVFWLLKR
jgi:hypothetical protein